MAGRYMREMEAEKETPEKRIGTGLPGPGRKKGEPNKNTTLLKDAILAAATKAGGEEGLIGYLTKQATANPAQFLGLLGKVLPLQLNGAGDEGQHVVERIIRRIVDPKADQ